MGFLGRMAVLLLLIGMSFGAKAETNDGSDLLKKCGEALKILDGAPEQDARFQYSAYCYGFISGFAATISITKNVKGGLRPLCLPKDGIANHQGVRIFVKYLRDNPQQLHWSGGLLLYDSLEQAFPCK